MITRSNNKCIISVRKRGGNRTVRVDSYYGVSIQVSTRLT
ncbi:hypothetical protein ECEC1865_1711 [Escherichia coli EC1865]|nr:hypothetical protein ECEC1865_1711 [Escherichia coli EC1865]